MPGGFSPYLGRIAQEAGFEAFFLAGSQTAAYLYGLPDVGIMGMRDLVDHARHLTARCDIPIFADADTGFGNAVGVYHTVQEYIRAGVAGMHIEDQEAPKKSGIFAGRRCISADEAIGKYRAAMKAKRELDPDFVICARCDVIGAENGTFDEAVERSIAYVKDAGVDMIWVNSMHSRDEIREVCRRIPAPVMCSYYGDPPTPSVAEWADLGVAVAIFPACAASAASQAAWEFLHEMKEQGPGALDTLRERARSNRWGPVRQSELLGEPAIREMEAEFLPEDRQRDYKGTFGHATN